jgi:hypothetical protein
VRFCGVDGGVTSGGGGGPPDTVTDDVPDSPSLVAVIAAVPTATPVTHPLAFTAAMFVLLLVHVIGRPVIG